MGSKRPKLDISTSVTDEIECTVCYQVPRGNIYECADGHHLCHICSKKVTNCPTCRSGGVGDRNRVLERVLNKMKFPCSWSEQGCEETVYRGQLSAHEDQCNHNPDTIKFCSMFAGGKDCGYKVTSKWLTDSDNNIKFIDHVNNCRDVGYNGNIRYGQRQIVTVYMNSILSKKRTPGTPVHHVVHPTFYEVWSQNQGKPQLCYFQPLLKLDSSGNQLMSFVMVQLTPLEERTPVFVKFAIDPIPNSEVVSKWGQDSMSSLNWTQKVISFKKFVEMVEKGTSLPYSLPVSLLSQYYTNSNKRMRVYFTLEEAP